MFTSTLERWPCQKAGLGPWAPLPCALQTPMRSQFGFLSPEREAEPLGSRDPAVAVAACAERAAANWE